MKKIAEMDCQNVNRRRVRTRVYLLQFLLTRASFINPNVHFASIASSYTTISTMSSTSFVVVSVVAAESTTASKHITTSIDIDGVSALAI